MEKKTISVPMSSLTELCQVIKGVKLKTSSDIRANLSLYQALGLNPIDEWMTVNEVKGAFASEAEAHAALQKYDEEFAKAFPAKDVVDCEISAANVATLREYLDHLAETFPAGKTKAGVDIEAGLPAFAARRIGPLIIAADEAWPPT